MYNNGNSNLLQVSLIFKQLELVETMSTPNSVRDKLQRVLDAAPEVMYEAVLGAIPLEHRHWAKKALMWISYAFRPLQLDELAVALAMEPSGPISLPVEDHIALDLAGDLKKVFGFLVAVEGAEVRFIHPSVKDFLDKESGDGKKWYQQRPLAHLEITRVCLAYLKIEEIGSSAVSYEMVGQTENRDRRHTKYELLGYASQFWPAHYRQSFEIPDTDKQEVLKFLEHAPLAHIWAEKDLYKRSSLVDRMVQGEARSPLCAAAQLGFENIVELLLTRSIEQPPERIYQAAALSMAALRGHTGVLQRLTHMFHYESAELLELLLETSRTGSENAVLHLITILDPKLLRPHAGTLLRQAAHSGYAKVGDILLCQDTREYISDQDAAVALRSAAGLGHDSLFQLLIDRCFVKEEIDPGTTVLHVAAAAGSLMMVDRLVQAGYSTKVRDGLSQTPLHTASIHGFPGVVGRLLTAGADVAAKDDFLRTPFHWTIMNDHDATARILLEHGADINLQDTWQHTPLHQAAQKGHEGLVRWLLSEGADVNIKDYGGEVPLHDASRHGFNEIASLLLSAGSDPNSQGYAGVTPVMIAAAEGFCSIVQLMVNHKDEEILSFRDENGSSALHFAAERGHVATARLLSDLGAEIDMKDDNGYTPLHLAAEKGHVAMLELLLKRHGGIEVETPRERTAIHLAALNGHHRAVQVLMNYDAKVEKPDWSGNTPLDLAAENGHMEIVVLLLGTQLNTEVHKDSSSRVLLKASSFGHFDVVHHVLESEDADVNFKDSSGLTALSAAAKFGSEAVVELLLLHGADPEIRDSVQRTSLLNAVTVGHEKVVELLLNARANVRAVQPHSGTSLNVAAHQGRVTMVRILLDHTADVSMNEGLDGYALQSAALSGSLETTQLLLEHNADISCKGGAYYSTLQAAIIGGNKKIVELLLQRGADVRLQGGKWGTALHAAIMRAKDLASPESTDDFVNLLLSNGASFHETDRQGRTAIHLAAASGDWPLMKQVLRENRGALNIRDSQGRTVLHHAACNGKGRILERLLVKQDTCDIPDYDGWTPLHWACRQPAEDVIEILLAKGADQSRKSVRGWTPRDVAVFHGRDHLLPDQYAHISMVPPVPLVPPPTSQSAVDPAPSEEGVYLGFICDGCLCVSTPSCFNMQLLTMERIFMVPSIIARNVWISITASNVSGWSRKPTKTMTLCCGTSLRRLCTTKSCYCDILAIQSLRIKALNGATIR
jgi:ankyrin repeat protein